MAGVEPLRRHFVGMSEPGREVRAQRPVFADELADAVSLEAAVPHDDVPRAHALRPPLERVVRDAAQGVAVRAPEDAVLDGGVRDVHEDAHLHVLEGAVADDQPVGGRRAVEEQEIPLLRHGLRQIAVHLDSLAFRRRADAGPSRRVVAGIEQLDGVADAGAEVARPALQDDFERPGRDAARHREAVVRVEGVVLLETDGQVVDDGVSAGAHEMDSVGGRRNRMPLRRHRPRGRSRRGSRRRAARSPRSRRA